MFIAPFFGLLSVLLGASNAYQEGIPKELIASHGAYSAHLYTTSRSFPKGAELTEGWWGAEQYGTLRVVSRITIKRGKNFLVVPVSAFSGLSLARELYVIPSKNGCKVKVVGSDASGAYTCVIVVRRDKVVERTVRLGEFPDLCYERTIYRTPRPGEID